MAGVRAGRWVPCALALLLLAAAAPRPAQALEAFDGRIQLHGFYEMQVRGLDSAFEEELDLAQWYQVINLELEVDILPDGWGPFDLLQAYVRAEGRYDCIYSGGCWMFPSVNTYGNDSQDLPRRLRDAKDDSWAGTIQVNEFEVPPGQPPVVPDTGPNARDPVPWGLLVLTPTPLGDKGSRITIIPTPTQRNRDPCFPDDVGVVDCTRYADQEFVVLHNFDATDSTNSPNFYDPNVPFFFDGSQPGQSWTNYCSVNNLPNAQDGRLSCIDQRPERFEVVKRQAFPGFDTLFDQGGADLGLGNNPDYESVANLPINDLINDGIDYDAVTPSQYWAPDDPVPDGNTIRTQYTNNLSGFRTGGRKSEQDIFRDALYGPLFRGVAQLRDDPAYYTFENVFDWRFTFRSWPGGEGGVGKQLPMGPWLPKNFFDSNATFVDRANPLRGRRTPTYIFSENVSDPLGGGMNQDSQRAGGIRYHVLDNDTLDENGNPVFCQGLSDNPAAVYCDPIDARIDKINDLTVSLNASGLQRPPDGRPDLAPYPNNAFLENTAGKRFGGDFSGIIPCFQTSTELRLGSPQRFTRQLLAREFIAGCVPYTNIQVTGGEGELPFRAAPNRSNLLDRDLQAAQGLYLPSAGLVRSFDEIDYDDHEFNISQIERAFNRGASQQDTYELKEAYADMEFFDSRLWIRAGLQNIVWGKTELFRTTDQFNPQDLALASLPSLEESRIALLSARAVWSFYDVGPLEDVRLELAANFDRFKPADLGACGEPYTIDIICALTLGISIHGITGVGVTGVDRPPAGWEDVDGVEFGGRIEFRWDRFSFAITDFYGYNDFPYPEPVFFYDRKIDFTSGRPVKAMAKSGCVNGAGILIQGPFFSPAANVNGDGSFNSSGVDGEGNPIPRVTKLVHAGTPTQYNPGDEYAPDDPILAEQTTVGERELRPTELYSRGNPDYDDPGQPDRVDLTYREEELARVGANDDYWRRMEVSTILGAGIDPGCLKPGGPAGGPSENRFDARKYATVTDFPRYSNPNTDEVTDVLNDADDGSLTGNSDTYINVTYGQWQREGYSVDPSLAFHPANQQLFQFICSGTVGIAVALSPSACAWNLFGVPVAFLAGESGPNFTEVMSNWLAGEQTFFEVHALLNSVVQATKSGTPGLIGGSAPFVALNSDIRDGRTDAMGSANNIGGARIASYDTGMGFSTGRFPSDDCPSPAYFSFLDPELTRGVCLKSSARDPWDYLGLGNTLTMEQKALLGCGPFYGTRCGSSERVVAIRYQQDQTAPPVPAIPGQYPAIPAPVSIPAGTDDVAGIVFAESQLLFVSDEARPVKLDAIGKETLTDDDYCGYVNPNFNPNQPASNDNPRFIVDDPDPCTIFGEGGGIDFLNMDGSVLIQSFPGVEGTTYGGYYEGAANTPGSRTWIPGKPGDARTYSLDPQPGTTGIPGLVSRVANPDYDPDDPDSLEFVSQRIEDPIPFVGGGVCTRYDPGNPLADSNGVVKLPGCRGAVEVVINDNLQTVDVVFEDGYTPRQDGCIFQRAIRLEQTKTRAGGNIPGRSFYYVRPVYRDRFIQDANGNDTADQALNVDLANELAETCWNGGAYANIIGADLSNPAVWRDGVSPLSRQPTEFYVDKASWEEGDIGNETIRNPKQYDPTFFSYTRRQIDCPRGDTFSQPSNQAADQRNRCRLSVVQLPSTGTNPDWRGLPTAAPFSIRNSRMFITNVYPRDERMNIDTGQGATNTNELFQVSQGLNANGTVFEPGSGSGRITRTGQSIIGAGTLWHPFAMCAKATFRNPAAGLGSGDTTWWDPENPPPGQSLSAPACNYRIRDYENDLLNQNAQVFQNELAAMSWNFMLFLVAASCNDKSGTDDVSDPDCFNPKTPWATGRCSYSTPQLCRNVKGFLTVNGVGRNDVRAGGNERFGRRQFIWHSGGEVALSYARRNVFGFSADFAEDVTKTNWGMEFTYIGKVPFFDNDAFNNITDSSAVNLTISVDRPTFINFLNANRTFFMNTQWFFQYLPNYQDNFTAPGPFNALFTFAVFTGYYQDRLLPQFVSVYDFRTRSGGFLPQLSYRFTEAFSMTFGISWFIGKNDYVTMPINGIAPVTNRAGRRAYKNGNQQLLSLISRRDEAFLRLRWTF